MNNVRSIRAGIVWLLAAVLTSAQNPPIMIDSRANEKPKPGTQQQPAPPPPGTQPAPAVTRPVTPAAAPGTMPGGLNLQNASLIEVIDILARALKINYILDPRVKGAVTINTYGEIKPVDLRPLLETILRINGAAMVQVGDLYRIVPIADVARLPISPQLNASGKDLLDDERMILDLVFLKYATVVEMSKLLQPFLGEG